MDKTGTSGGKHDVFPTTCTKPCPQLLHRRMNLDITIVFYLNNGALMRQ